MSKNKKLSRHEMYLEYYVNLKKLLAFMMLGGAAWLAILLSKIWAFGDEMVMTTATFLFGAIVVLLIPIWDLREKH